MALPQKCLSNLMAAYFFRLHRRRSSPSPTRPEPRRRMVGGDGNGNRLIGAKDGIMRIAVGSLPLEPQGIVPDKIGGP